MTARKKSDAKNSVVKKKSEKSQYKSANLKDVSDFIVKTISKSYNNIFSNENPYSIAPCSIFFLFSSLDGLPKRTSIVE